MNTSSQISEGDVLELTIHGFAHRGFGVARTDAGQVVFVSDTMPGERVRARVSDASKKNFLFAETLEVLDKSPHRILHVWPEASLAHEPESRAGGAELGFIELHHQRVLKSDVLLDALKRFGKMSDTDIAQAFGSASITEGSDVALGSGQDPAQVLEGLEDDEGLHWRTRIRLRADEDGNLGVYARRTNSFVPIYSFPLATTELLAEAPIGQTFEGVDTLDIIQSSTGETRLVIDQLPSSRILTEHVSWQTSNGDAVEHDFVLAENGFWQVHRDAPRALATTTASLIGKGVPSSDEQSAGTASAADRLHHFDLYAGVGLFTAVLASELGEDAKIFSVEVDSKASEYAARNVEDFSNTETVTADVMKYLRQLNRSREESGEPVAAVGTVLLDPPRSGAGKQVVSEIAKLAPEQIIYVACDPVALARDIQYFSTRGYKVEQLRALDLFPNTYHFETIARLVPADA